MSKTFSVLATKKIKTSKKGITESNTLCTYIFIKIIKIELRMKIYIKNTDIFLPTEYSNKQIRITVK